MAEGKRSQLQSTYAKFIEEIDRLYMRKIQKEMHECSAKCCDNKTGSIEEVSICVQKCSVKLNESNNYCSAQYNNIQERLQRCVSQCNDEAKDKLGVQPTDREVEEASKLFEHCACICIDKQIEYLPLFTKKIKEVLSQKLENKPV